MKLQDRIFPKLPASGPVALLLVFYLSGLAVFCGFRAALFIKYFPRVWGVEDCLFLFVVGLRMDTILLCYLMFPLFILSLLLPGKSTKKIFWVYGAYCSFFIALMVFLEFATFPFMEEFDTRPDRLFIEHMVQVREVLGMVWVGYKKMLGAALLVMLLIGATVYKITRTLVRADWSLSLFRRIVLFVLIAPLLFMGARSSLRHRPANIHDAAFSGSHLVNQLALNSSYNLAYAYVSQKDEEECMGQSYGSMEPEEMLRLVRQAALIPEGACTNTEIPLLHYQEAARSTDHPLNLVIIIEESLGAEYVGCLGGMPLTPHFDRLSRQGLLFTNLYCTGTRTLRAIEAVIAGFLPTPGKSVVKLGLAERNFFTIAELLRRRGYATEFIYGGDANFDNMNVFCYGNGFEKIYDERSIENPAFKGNWGVADEDLFVKANQVLASHGQQPFFALILTTSHHDPFEFPDGRIELFEQPKMTRHNAIKYADYALGEFLQAAQKEAYYRNTIFLVVADHSTRLSGADLIPIQKFHVPGLIIGPRVSPGEYTAIASQIDLLPTLLDLMGVSAAYPHAGRHLLSLPPGTPGRAVMQYGETNCYMLGSQVLIQYPEKDPAQFLYRDGRLVPEELDPELARAALAHALLPGYLYYNFLHRLP